MVGAGLHHAAVAEGALHWALGIMRAVPRFKLTTKILGHLLGVRKRGHLAIYVDRKLNPLGVAHYSDPSSLVQRRKRIKKGGPLLGPFLSSVKKNDQKGSSLFGLCPSLDVCPLLGRGVYWLIIIN